MWMLQTYIGWRPHAAQEQTYKTQALLSGLGCDIIYNIQAHNLNIAYVRCYKHFTLPYYRHPRTAHEQTYWTRCGM